MICTIRKKFQELVICWKIRKYVHYKIEDRGALRKTSDISSWQRAFSKYLDDLSCPHSDRTISPVTTDWLLGLAVRLVYGENPQRYRKCTRQTSSTSKDVAPSSNPLDSLDFDDEAMKAGITTLATLLQIPPHHDHKEVLK
ncbi:C14orf166 [Bugula neritina]|uniref:C14orf166 n=1 Tax=Bugula neritina TaxID=10212 RepID=A0A7J7JVA4_BUGNE|nr:C14orf166 [Bugula neritina]